MLPDVADPIPASSQRARLRSVVCPGSRWVEVWSQGSQHQAFGPPFFSLVASSGVPQYEDAQRPGRRIQTVSCCRRGAATMFPLPPDYLIGAPRRVMETTTYGHRGVRSGSPPLRAAGLMPAASPSPLDEAECVADAWAPWAPWPVCRFASYVQISILSPVTGSSCIQVAVRDELSASPGFAGRCGQRG